MRGLDRIDEWNGNMENSGRREVEGALENEEMGNRGNQAKGSR